MKFAATLTAASAFMGLSYAFPAMTGDDLRALEGHKFQEVRRQNGKNQLQFDPTLWKPAGKGDSRSPCPGLNSLANHGLINHSGKNITDDAVKRGFQLFGATDKLAEHVLYISRLKKIIPESTWNLEDTNVHNAVEIDASASRQDAYFGDWVSFNQTIFDQFVGSITAENNGEDAIQFGQYVRAKRARIADSKKNNPEFFWNKANALAGTLNLCSAWGAMQGTPRNTVSMEQLKVFFQEERFPTELGWSLPKNWFTIARLYECVTAERFVPNKNVKGSAKPSTDATETAESQTPETAEPLTQDTAESEASDPVINPEEETDRQ